MKDNFMEDNNMELDNPMSTEEIPASILEVAKKIGRERKRLYGMIKSVSHRVGVSNLAQEDLVVSIGCGDGLDSLPINSALSGRPFGVIGKIRLVGIDLDQKALQSARKDNRGEVEEYIYGDARNLNSLLNGEKPIVAIARHPNIAEKEQEWAKVFQETYKALKNDGTFIVTSMQNFERES